MKNQLNIKWTPSQQQAIETVGRNVLVTASAGTGKTAVLSQRVVERITDGSDPARADTMLVLTFTEAAAEEMRSRIADTLYKRYLQTRQPRLRQQLLLLDRAYISTIHSFCKRILTEFFYLIELDPTFGILNADEQQLLKSELLEEMLEEAWADETLSEGMESLFTGRRVQPGTQSFVDLIIPLTEFLDSVVSRDKFYANAAAMIEDTKKPNETLLQAQKEILLHKVQQCRDRLDYAIKLDGRLCDGSYATSHIREKLIPAIEQCRVLLENDRFDLCSDHIADLDFGRMPVFKKSQWPEHAKDLIKESVDRTKTQVKELADFALLCREYQNRLAPQVALQTQVLLQLMQRFDACYAAVKKLRNVLDFADLEHRTLQLLTQHPEVAAKLAKRFDYIFVDEFQDINAPQKRILELISNSDNVFVVGDFKQSIYGFRQSKPEIFLEQLVNATDLSTPGTNPGRVDLRDNFRCRTEIIDFVNALFRRTMTLSVTKMDYDDRAELIGAFKYPPFEAKNGPVEPVEIVFLDEREDEIDEMQPDDESDTPTKPTEPIGAAQRQAAWIARRIQQIVGAETGTPEFQVYDKQTGGFRDVQYRDIVILMRSLSHKGQDYTEILRLAGVPVHSQSACGYFETTEIADCLSLLKVLDNPDRDIELAALLRSPVFGVTDTGLAKVCLHAGKKNLSFWQAVRNYAADGSEQSLAQKCAQIVSQINDWRRQVRSGSLADFLDGLFRQKGLLSFYAALPNGSQRCANLQKLHDHAIHFEHFRTTEPGTALVRFVEYLEKLDEAEQDWAPAEPGSSGQNAVRLMSIHKSKGLEFPVVFVAELNTRFNMRDSVGECLIDEGLTGLQIVDRNLAVKLPSMAHQIIAERKTCANLAEEMRILYVALTRAREKLILTGNKKQKACRHLLTQCAAMAGPVPDWKLIDIRSHLDWILSGFANESLLHTLFETGFQDEVCDNGLFFARRIQRDHLDDITRDILNAKRSLSSATEAIAPVSASDSTTQQAFEIIQQNLNWQYPSADVTQMQAKLSVSELTHRDDEFAGINIHRGFDLQPQITLKESDSLLSGTPDALSLGTAYHLIIEHLDLFEPVDSKAVQSTIQILIQNGQLSESIATTVDITDITSFFESPLGQMAQQAGRHVLREWPFTYGLDASAIGADSAGETVILQGIVDMVIPANEGLVVVDFKTDRVEGVAIEDRAKNYADQLRHYARAVNHILKQPVVGAWLYFLMSGTAIQIDL